MGVTEKDVQNALKAVKDPELNLDVVVLGLIYDVEITEGDVHVVMSLTSPMCPVAEQLVSEAQATVLAVEGVTGCEVDLTFDPPWTPERISPLIRSSLGL
ncbi:MAG TPA: metal-sulfur cluster assembly factor [Gemmatimonadetes bacterium]|jgi:metal-sulfur cluster biosynthetic enzyme|nr:metal-sulfur cluster assembly factor [Gemmatimonadota bacterium]